MTKKNIIILAILILAYTLYFSWATISRHQNLFSGRYDLGNMEQTVWNTSEGRIFQMTNPDTSNISSRLSFHSDFLLILIAPIYKIFPFTETLLIIQAFVVALGAIPVYLIAKHIFKRNRLPLLFSLLYLLSPIVERANIFDFHSEVLAITFLLFTFYFLLTNRLKSFLLFFFLALISKETISLTLAAICFWGIIKNKNRKLCVFLLVFCFAYFFLMVKFLIPQANETTANHFALRHFEEGEEGLEKLALSYFTSPIKSIIILISNDTHKYLFKIFSESGFLALFSPLTLLFTLPTTLINILVKDSQFRSLKYQYSASIVPGLIISTIYGTQILIKKLQKYKFLAMKQWSNGTIIIVAILIIIYSLHKYSPLPLIGKSPYLDFLSYHYPAKQKLTEWAAKIPEGASVSATNNAGSHLAKRQNLYAFPNKINEADYIVIANKSWQEWVTSSERDKIIEKLKVNPKYTIVEESKDLWIFKKS